MKKNQTLVITLSVMLAVALTACVSIPLTAPAPAESTDADSAPVSVSDDRLNVLVTGTDRTSGLTDVIMLVSIDRKNNAASLLQIPRDTYASYTSGSYKKLNGAYGALGAEGLCEFLSDSLGITVDKYLMLSPDAFCGAVDAIGGVEITLDKPMRYSDPAQGLYISLDAGRQTLDGKTAEQFIRYRSGYADGDLGRLDAQKLFLCALLQSARENMTPLTLTRVTVALLGKTDTNITPVEGATLAEVVMAMDGSDITLLTAPGEAVVAEASGASYYSLSARAMGEVLERYFGGAADGFDKKGVFLNKSYESFGRVYRGYSAYKVSTAENIAAEGD